MTLVVYSGVSGVSEIFGWKKLLITVRLNQKYAVMWQNKMLKDNKMSNIYHFAITSNTFQITVLNKDMSAFKWFV